VSRGSIIGRATHNDAISLGQVHRLEISALRLSFGYEGHPIRSGENLLILRCPYLGDATIWGEFSAKDFSRLLEGLQDICSQYAKT
jgi:hypothetical protein